MLHISVICGLCSDASFRDKVSYVFLHTSDKMCVKVHDDWFSIKGVTNKQCHFYIYNIWVRLLAKDASSNVLYHTIDKYLIQITIKMNSLEFINLLAQPITSKGRESLMLGSSPHITSSYNRILNFKIKGILSCSCKHTHSAFVRKPLFIDFQCYITAR